MVTFSKLTCHYHPVFFPTRTFSRCDGVERIENDARLQPIVVCLRLGWSGTVRAMRHSSELRNREAGGRFAGRPMSAPELSGKSLGCSAAATSTKRESVPPALPA